MIQIMQKKSYTQEHRYAQFDLRNQLHLQKKSNWQIVWLNFINEIIKKRLG